MPNTEAFYRFHRFNEAFDRDLKVTFGVLEGLRTGAFPSVDGKTSLPIGKEPWKKLTSFADPVTAARDATRQTATMGIVRVTAAFEDFLITLEGDYQRTAITREPAGVFASTAPATGEDGTRIAETCERLGLDPQMLTPILPFHEYFYSARNCIVHRNGRASRQFIEIARSDRVAAAHANLPTRSGAVPALPAVREGLETDWLPRHAILCASVYYWAARTLNVAMSERLGRDGFVYMAAHYGLLDADPVDSGARRTAESVIRTILNNRYRYRGLKVREIVETLKRINKWQACLHAFDTAGAQRNSIKAQPARNAPVAELGIAAESRPPNSVRSTALTHDRA